MLYFLALLQKEDLEFQEMLERLRIIEENILQLEQLKVHSLEEIKDHI